MNEAATPPGDLSFVVVMGAKGKPTTYDVRAETSIGDKWLRDFKFPITKHGDDYVRFKAPTRAHAEEACYIARSDGLRIHGLKMGEIDV